MKLSIFAIFAILLCDVTSLTPPAAQVWADPLYIKDIIKPPVNLTFSGTYYSDREKAFSVEVAPDRFIKAYSDGVTIIGVKDEDTPSITSLTGTEKPCSRSPRPTCTKQDGFSLEQHDNPRRSARQHLLTAPGEIRDGCTVYRVSKGDVELCVDPNYHIPVLMSQNGHTVARVESVQPLDTDLKAMADSLILTCRHESYTLFDLDADMAPDAD